MSTTQRLGKRIIRSGFFKRLKNRAMEYVRNPDKLTELIHGARRKSESEGRKGILSDIWDSLMALFRLLRAYAKGEYRDIPTSQLVLIVAALLYFVIPIDVIPDFVVGVGLLDDAAVLGWVIMAVRTALDDFLKWESARQLSSLGTIPKGPP